MSEIYRDGSAGLRAQVAAKRAALAELQGRVTPLLRALTPSALQDRMVAEAEALGAVDEDDMTALASADARLGALLAAHEEALALAQDLRACPDAVPDPPYAGAPPPWLLEERWHQDLRRVLEPRVSLADPNAYIVRWGDRSYLARMRSAFEPLVYVVSLEAPLLRASLRTTVPEGVPPLDVRPERTYHAAFRALHLASEIAVGDDVFDRRFWVTGHAASAALLTPEVRERLSSLHPLGPALTIAGGIVELAWTSLEARASRDVLPRDALDVVLGIRAAVATA